VLLVKHFHLADNIMNVLRATASAVWGAIKTVVGLVVKAVVGYIKLWIAAITFVIRVTTSLVGIVSRAFSAVVNTIRNSLSSAATFIHNVWDGIVRFVSGLGSRLARGARNIWNWITEGIKAQVNIAIGIINWLIRAIDALQIHVHIDPPGPGSINFDWSGFNLPEIPTLAKGGMVLRTGLAVVHEGESFSGVGGGLGGTVNVYVAGSVIAEHDLAATVQKALLRSKKRSGPLGLD